jgi:hypothetical protein
MINPLLIELANTMPVISKIPAKSNVLEFEVTLCVASFADGFAWFIFFADISLLSIAQAKVFHKRKNNKF